MNETVLLNLKIIVERAVRPVRASLCRKKKMREELLAHVNGVFEDELLRCGDEAAALIQAEKRFGDPSELARKLQESVPKRDRFAFLCERLIEPRAGESLVRRAVRYGIMSFMVHASLTIALSLLLFPLLGKVRELGTIVYILLLVSVSIGVMAFVATLLTNWLVRTLFGASGRSLFKASLPMTLSCLVPVIVPLFFSVATYPFGSDNRILSLSTLWCTLPATLLAPLAFIGMAKLLSDDNRYCEEWGELQID